MKIGFFDSGVGGLNVLYEGFLNLPQETKFVYFADHDNVPYGSKTTGQIKALLANALEFLKKQNCDAIVIACNTASSVADMEFRASFALPIVAMEPAIKPALERFNGENILITATNATIKGEKLAHLLENLNATNCDLLALPRFVEIAQSSNYSTAQDYVNTLGLEKYDIIVLGCTHFNYFKHEMKIANKTLNFIDGNFGAIKHLANKLNVSLEKGNSSLAKFVENTDFFISSRVPNADEMELIKLSLARAKMCHAIN